MNIFFVDSDPQAAAHYLYWKHKLKMIVESTQLLSVAVHQNCSQNFDESLVYKSTHVNHPCAIWTRASYSNFCWLFDHATWLSNIYFRKYEKIHASVKVLKYIRSLRLDFDEVVLTEPPQCMPEQYRGPSVVEAYRKYYAIEKLIVRNEGMDSRLWAPGWAAGAPRFPTGLMYVGYYA